MPPKDSKKKTKAEEALDFLSNLDNLDDAPASATSNPTTEAAPRASTDSSRTKGKPSVDLSSAPSEAARGSPAPKGTNPAEDEEAQKALAFLEAQIKTKRAPLSAPKATSRPATPAAGPGAGVGPNAAPAPPAEANVPSAPPAAGTGGGWGVSSFWSSATSAIQSAQKIADEQYKKVKTEGVGGVAAGGLGGLEGLAKSRGIDVDALKKGAGERLGGLQGYVKGVDLEKLRQDLLNTTSSTLTSILNTVAPPISAHETLELWLTHPMAGYAGVEGVVYRAWSTILEQTESGELIIVWSPEKEGQDDGERAINPADGWEEAWKRQNAELEHVKGREGKDPRGRAETSANVPVTTIPIFLHLQPILAPLPFAEPPVLMKGSSSTASSSAKHLYFIMTLHDPVHSLRFSTVSQPSPADWLDVEYDRSDWVEERLVEVLRTGVEILAQDYVATRMGLKPSTITQPATPTTGDAAVASENEVKTAKKD